MIINKLFDTIQNFSFTREENRFHVTSLPDLPHKLGCTEEGYPKFFIEVGSCSETFIKNYNAELLSVEFDVLCNIVENGQRLDDKVFSIITLHSENEQLQRTFIDVFFMMLRILPQFPTKKQIASKVESLLSVFAKLKRKPTHKLQGLWAELLVIERSCNPSVVASAWHSSAGSKYDFTLGSDKIEVKSTSGENRIHRFSLDQLNPAEHSNLLICSIILRESGKDINGLSIYDLYQRISSRIDKDEIRLHVYDVILDTVGKDFYVAQKKFFDYSAACDSLALFDYRLIPKIDKSSIPKLVTEVKFSSDLTYIQDVRDDENSFKDSILFQNLF